MAALPTAPDPPPPDAIFRHRFTGTEMEVRNATCAACGWMRGRGIGEPHAGTAQIVLAEALNNIVEHALSTAPGGWIDLEMRDLGESLAVSITDDGAPMPNGRLPRTAPPEPGVTRAEMPEGGFGWHLIRQLAQSLDYRRENGRNRLRLTLACPDREA